MITVNIGNNRGNKLIQVHHVVNRGQWFKKYWLVCIQMGFESTNFLIEADSESDCIDELVDSKYGHLLKTEDQCTSCESENYDNCTCDFGDNFSERIDLEDVSIYRVKSVNWFANSE